MNSITGTKLQDEILMITALSVFADKEALMMLNTKRYTENTLSKMKSNGWINEREGKPKLIRMKKKGVELIRDKDEELYEHYMRHSGENNPGMTKRHMELYRRTSQVLTIMYQAGISIGAENPQLWQIRDGTKEKNNKNKSTFYCGKELIYEEEQKYVRSRLSRATGQIISPGIKGLVYNIGNSEIKFSKSSEMETNIRMSMLCKELFSGLPNETIQHSIIVGENEDIVIDAVNRALTEKRKKGVQSWSLGDVIVNQNITGTEFHYIDLSPSGVQQLKTISCFTEDECKVLCFSEKERMAVNGNQRIDAIVGNLKCFEFVSANISKLAYVKKYYADKMSEVGIACCENQREFVKKFFGQENLHMRIINEKSLEKAITERRNIYDEKIAKGMA